MEVSLYDKTRNPGMEVSLKVGRLVSTICWLEAAVRTHDYSWKKMDVEKKTTRKRTSYVLYMKFQENIQGQFQKFQDTWEPCN